MTRQKRIARIRENLIAKMETVQSSVHSTMSNLKTTGDVYADPFDQAALDSSKSVELNCRSKDWQSLLEIKETLLRMDRGLYGVCDACGRRISQKRMEAAPFCRLCIDCQGDREQRQRAGRSAMMAQGGCGVSL